MRIYEMAIPNNSQKEKIFYHGTASMGNAMNILHNGLDPSKTEIKFKDTQNDILYPQKGMVYLTPHLYYAILYAVRHDFFGKEIPKKVIENEGQYGYILQFSGMDLQDIEPDEDSIGEFLHIWYNQTDEYIAKKHKDFLQISKHDMKKFNQFFNIVSSTITKAIQNKIKNGDISSMALFGKKLIPLLPDEIKLWLIDLGAHIAHRGVIKPTHLYKIDKNQLVNLKKTDNLTKYLIPL